MQFSLMTLLGLREGHSLLDIGCGSLRAGRLFIVYLLPDHYCGIEPEEWLVREGLARELGPELSERKRPRFQYSAEFPCTAFGHAFDYLLAQSIFSHASIAQIRRCLTACREVMHAQSLFAASFLEGERDYDGDEWRYPDCVQYRAATIERLAGEAGLASRRLDWFHAGGQTWYLLFLPGLEPEIEVLGSLNHAAMLKNEMRHYRQRSERLERIEAHPLFRLAGVLRRTARRAAGR